MRQEKTDLLNRLQSEDFRTYSVLTSATTAAPVADYTVIPRTDEAEMKQLQDMGAGQGLGDVLYDDDEFRDTLGEFGLSFGNFGEEAN